jgi:NADPH-dependent curcumin reductase CurA
MARRPVGVPVAEDFAFSVVDVPAPGASEVMVAPETISLDPYIRLRMAARHLVGNLQPGDPIASEMVGRVVASGDPRFVEGDIVAGHAPWQTLATVPAEELRHPGLPEGLPSSLALGVLGMPGLTAYAGVERLMKPGAGDVVLVSAASGPVGSTVGQLAKARGARVIGIAGGPEKCSWVTSEAGFEACIDYRAGPIAEQMAVLSPEGPTAYFDNVGGEMLRTVLGLMRPGGRIVLCGIVADYNGEEQAPGPTPLEIISARASLHGLVVYDHEDLRPALIAEVGGLIAAGRFAWREDVAEGFDMAPAAFARLMRGENQGKAVLRV